MAIQSQTIPIYKISKKIAVDGDLSDWNTPFSSAFVVHNSGSKASQDTFVSLSWNDDNLYIAFRSVDCNIVGGIKEKDAEIFKTDDLVELFIDADGDRQNYLELGVNAFSSNYDMVINCVSPFCGGWKTNISFNIQDIETVSKITAEGYVTEIKIPFSSLEKISEGNFKKPLTGTKWKGNIFRIDYGTTTEYLALKPYKTENFGFHKPQEFVDFEFMESNFNQKLN